MNNIFFPAILLSLLGVCAFTSASAQEPLEYSSQAEQTFSKSLELFNGGQYSDAAAGFDQVIKMYAPNQRTTAAYVMRAKALLRTGESLEAARTIRNFLSLYPTSSYVPDAEYTMGLVYLKIQRYDDAAESFLAAWRSAAPASRAAFEALDRTLGAFFPTDTLRSMIGRARSDEERAYFWLKIGEMESAAGRVSAVEAVLDTLYRNYPVTSFSSRIAMLRTRAEEHSAVKLGVLLPLLRKAEPSAVKEIGNDVFEGIQFAVEEYSKNPRARIAVTLETRDTERDALVAARGIQELTSDDAIVGILGPVFSHEASAVASLANKRGYPLISPTANANGIGATGQYVFQANPDYETRGRAMARYAIEKRGFRVLAVLAPINTFGKYMAEAFITEALRLGAKVIATEWYERGAADLKSQLASLRRAGLKAGAEPMLSFGGKMNREDMARLAELGVSMKTLDSLMHKSALVGATTLLGPRARQMVDSLGLQCFYAEIKEDSLEYPVTALDGIYIPISSADEIGIVSSQVVYYNIKCQILGSGEWNNLAQLIANKRYCNDVLFESDNHADLSDPAYQQFATRYAELYKKKPSKNTLYGYDTAKLVLDLIREGGATREALMNGLTMVQDFHGQHSKIGFSDKRVNTWVWILRYSDDQVQKVDEFNVK